MKPKPVLGMVLLAALAPLAWAGPQAAQSTMAASSRSRTRAHGKSHLTGQTSNAAIRSGTHLSARLLTNLNARKAKPGQKVEARVTQNVKQNGHIIIRKNSRLVGHVVSARAAGKGHDNSQIQVVFDHLVRGRTTTSLNTVVTSIVSVPRAPMPQPMAPMSAAPAPMGASPAGGGGLLGGAGGAVGSTVGGAVGGAAGAAGSVAGNAGAMAGSTMGTAGRMGAAASGSLADATTVTNSVGAIGAGSAAHAAGAATAGASGPVAGGALHGSGQASGLTAATSTFNRRHGNVQLHSGTQMQFEVAGSAHARTPARR